MDEQVTQTPRPGLPPVIRNIAGGILLLTLAAWIAQALGCYHELWSYCGGSAYVTLAGLVALGVLGPLGLSYRERALRRARRGMWAGSSWGAGHELTTVFRRAVKFVIEGETEPDQAPGLITGMQRFERRGWWVTVPALGGRAIWVDRYDFWLWLQQVEEMHPRMEPGESVIGERLWESRIGRPMWMAYVTILETIDATDCPTGDPRSRRYRPGLPWGRVEEFEQLRPSETK